MSVDKSTKERRRTLRIHMLSFLCTSFIHLCTFLQICEYVYEVLFSCISTLASMVANMYLNITQENIYRTEALL